MQANEPSTPNALIVQSTSTTTPMLAEVVRGLGLEPVPASGGVEALRCFREISPAVVILDLGVADVPARQLLEQFAGAGQVPVVAIADGGDVRAVVEAVRAGAADVVDRRSGARDLERAIRSVLPDIVARAVSSGQQIPAMFLAQYEQLFRGSEKMRALEPVVARLASVSAPVLIRGESGVGKEGVALAIHYLSDRAGGPFVKVPCGGLPADVLEAELRNMVAAAAGGTLFLHEVGEMSAAAQHDLAYGLEGSDGALRVLASTSADMYALVAGGRFKGDLYERLAVVTIDVPPLRERVEDIDRLVPRFLERFAREADRPAPGLTEEMRTTLRSYAWPGNIRELESIVKRWVLLGIADPIREEIAARQAAAARGRPSNGITLGLRDIARAAAREAERIALQEALRRAKGNRAAVARELRVSYKTLLQKLSEVGLATTPRRRREM